MRYTTMMKRQSKHVRIKHTRKQTNTKKTSEETSNTANEKDRKKRMEKV
jgi:hypothetical protein